RHGPTERRSTAPVSRVSPHSRVPPPNTTEEAGPPVRPTPSIFSCCRCRYSNLSSLETPSSGGILPEPGESGSACSGVCSTRYAGYAVDGTVAGASGSGRPCLMRLAGGWRRLGGDDQEVFLAGQISLQGPGGSED